MQKFIDVNIEPVLMDAIITVWSGLYFILLCTNFILLCTNFILLCTNFQKYSGA